MKFDDKTKQFKKKKDAFLDVLDALRQTSTKGPCCGILTKSPETVLIYFADNAQKIMLFDSHSQNLQVFLYFFRFLTYKGASLLIFSSIDNLQGFLLQKRFAITIEGLSDCGGVEMLFSYTMSIVKWKQENPQPDKLPQPNQLPLYDEMKERMKEVQEILKKTQEKATQTQYTLK